MMFPNFQTLCEIWNMTETPIIKMNILKELKPIKMNHLFTVSPEIFYELFPDLSQTSKYTSSINISCSPFVNDLSPSSLFPNLDKKSKFITRSTE